MPAKSKLTPDNIAVIRAAAERNESTRAIARAVGVSPGTVTRALSRIVDQTRTAEEFKGALSARVRPPAQTQGGTSWDLETIRLARDNQLQGHFKLPVSMAEATRTDDAIYTAYHNRVAPQSAVQANLVPASGSRGAALARKAALSCHVPRSVVKGLHGTLANHGIAIGYVDHEPSDDGTRVDFRLTEWPLEHVRWNPSREVLETRTREGARVDILHGDGRWVVIRKFGLKPWAQEAAVLPASFIWAAHAEGIKDWAGASTSHGQPKMIGELPEGLSTHRKDADGNVVMTPEAEALLQMMQDLVSGEAGAGIQPHGGKTTLLANGSTAWQVFSELIQNREKAAARVYQGTDATLGSVGGAPGVDIATLFGVATTKIQGDFEAIEQGLNTGLYAPWAAVNDGTSRYAPRLKYQMPDPDASAKSKERSEQMDRLLATVERMRANQMDVTQEVVNDLAASFGVHPVPQLADVKNRRIPIELAPTDVARVVRVNEARASQGLPPLDDARGDLFISELESAAEAKGDVQVVEAEAANEPAT